LIFSAFFAAGLFLYLVRYRNRLQAMYAAAKGRSVRDIVREEISFAKQGRSILVTILIVGAIFALLGFFNSLRIKPMQLNGTGLNERLQEEVSVYTKTSPDKPVVPSHLFRRRFHGGVEVDPGVDAAA
jgi:hypothetical protein